MHYLKLIRRKLITFLKKRFIFVTRSSGGVPIISNEKSGFIINFTNNVFLTTHARPRLASEIKLESTDIYNANDYAIIIQGPIGNYNDFLVETILLYQKIFPNVQIIVSTWKNENHIDKIKKLDVIVLQTDIPISSGLFNVDLQTLSTSVGLDYAEKKGIKYCIKTRADCRLHKPNTISFLKSKLDTFPLDRKVMADSRIIASSVASCKYRVYGLTDIFLFGSISDLQKYFCPQPQIEWLKSNNLNFDAPLINGTPVISEIFLCARYLDSLNEELEWSLEHWWKCLKDFFCIVDVDSIDLFWFKHDWHYEKRFTRGYGYKSPRAIEFSDWFVLYSGESNNWGKIEYQEKWVQENGKLKQSNVF